MLHAGFRIVVYRRAISDEPGIKLLKQGVIEGENPVFDSELIAYDACGTPRKAPVVAGLAQARLGYSGRRRHDELRRRAKLTRG
jgi:hypothetical protein